MCLFFQSALKVSFCISFVAPLPSVLLCIRTCHVVWCTVWAFQKAVNFLLIVKETTAVSGPAGPRGCVLCWSHGLFYLVLWEWRWWRVKGGVEVSKGECWNSVIAVVRVSNLYSSSGIKIECLALRYRLLAHKVKLNSKLLRLKECWCTRHLHDQPYGGICSRVVHHSVFLLGFLNQDCMEEINLFSENKTHLKQLGEQLITASNKTKETEINDKLKDVNDRWQHLFDHIEAR